MPASRIPSLNWLRVFEAAARTESFARAAEHLNMSAAAVSQQIKALETHLGRELFSREAKRVVLTEVGRSFLPAVQQSLFSVETTAAALFGTREEEQVTVQMVSILAVGWLAPRLAGFEQAHPGIRINVNTANLVSDFGAMLPGRDADLQIAFGSATDFPTNAERLFGETLYAVALPEAAEAIDSAEAVTRHTLNEVATHRSGWHQVLSGADGADIGQCRLRMVDNTPLALALSSSGDGLALARAPATDFLLERFGLARVKPLAPVQGNQHYYLFTGQTRPMRKGASLFRDWLLTETRRIAVGNPA